jgi:hypothetical protein
LMKIVIGQVNRAKKHTRDKNKNWSTFMHQSLTKALTKICASLDKQSNPGHSAY